MTTRIVVGADASPEGADALRLAQRLATALHAELTIVEDFFETALLEKARTIEAAYVIMGSAKIEGSTKLDLGPLAHVLAHELDCPLIVVPASLGEGDRSTANDIVVGIDGSAASRAALELSCTLAGHLGATVYAVHSNDGIDQAFTSRDNLGRDEYQARADVSAASTAVRYVPRTGINAQTVLSEVARERHAALLVVAAKERHALGGLLLGRVPRHLLSHPPCPVMVLPHRVARLMEKHPLGR